MSIPEALQTVEVFSTPWFSLVAKTAEGETDPHYAIRADDYTTILAVTREERIVLVRQFRHAVEGFTLELPAGHVENGETPEDSARRELLEETGYRADKVELLGCLHPDTGRLANRMWSFFARDVEPFSQEFCSEDGIEVSTCSPAELAEKIRTGEFNHALHHAVLLLAVIHNKLNLGDRTNG